MSTSLASSQTVKINYYALVVSILKNCIPETAFEKVQSDKPGNVQNQMTDADWKDMAKLRAEGLFYRELGEIYCMDKVTVYRRLKAISKQGV